MTPLEQIEINKNYLKLKKALEIIRKKNVEIQKIKYCFLKDNDIGLITYNRNLVDAHLLTQEEFNLLKEVL